MRTILSSLLAVIILSSCSGVSSQTAPNFQSLCESNSGTWLQNTLECEYISKDICESNGGEFQECASACRNNPEAQMCTMQCVLVCDFSNDEVPAKAESNANNTAYLIGDDTFILHDGVADMAENNQNSGSLQVFSSTPFIDENHYQNNNVAVLLTLNSEGSGSFFYVSIFDGEKSSNAVLLGDRIAPQNINFQEGYVVVNYVDRMPWESFAIQPSLAKSKYLTFDNGRLQEVSKVPPLTRLQAELLAQDAYGDCENRCSSSQVDVLDGKDDVWFIQSTQMGMLDDSVDTIKRVAMAHFIDNEWVLGDALQTWFVCKEGRGQQEWGTEFCK